MNNQNQFDLFEGLEVNEEQKIMINRIENISEIILKIVKRRNEMKLTQRELAELTSIKQPMIARIEALKTIPRLDTLITICHALKMHLSFTTEEF